MKTEAAKRHATPPAGLSKVDKQDDAVLEKAVKASAASETSTFTAGKSSAAVSDLKHLLSVDGYATPGGKTFDAKTATALEQFQTAMNLKPTGDLNASTLKALVSTETAVRTHPGELHVGEKSAGTVGTLENELKTLGYATPAGTVRDGVYTKGDAAHLEAFRAADRMKYRGSALGNGGKEQLASDVKSLEHDPYRVRQAPTSRSQALNAATTKSVGEAAAKGTPGIGLGAKGEAVSNLQSHLESAGFDPKGDQGTFGARTVGAVEAFQKKSGLPVTGAVDAKTWSALEKSVIASKSVTSPPQSLGEKSGAVHHTQQQLIEAGFGKHLKATGLFDATTQKAVQAFQKKEHLPVTGEVNGATLKKLETVAKKNAWSAGSWHPGPGTLFGHDTSSSYQSDAQFQRSIKGAQWSAIKASDGVSGTQSSFASRWAELGKKVASGQMKLRMAYCYLEPENGVAQAKHFLSTVGVHGKLPAGTRLALDWEGGALSDPQALKDAANYIHQVTGVWPVVYCQGSEVSAAEANVPHAPIWEAAVDAGGMPLPTSERNRNVAFFQYGWGTDGVGFDEDQFNGNLSSLEKFAGYT